MSPEITATTPRVGHSVEIHEPGGRSSLGRVQSVGDPIVVAVPSDAAITMAGDIDAAFSVVWPVPNGVMLLPATLTARRSSPQIDLWEFHPTAAATFEQRRIRLRIPASGPVAVVVRGDERETTLDGTLVDLSEAALQCVVDESADDVVLTSGTAVSCRFDVDGTPLELRGTVHAAWTVDIPPRVRVVVRFEPDQAGAATLACFVADSYRAAAD